MIWSHVPLDSIRYKEKYVTCALCVICNFQMSPVDASFQPRKQSKFVNIPTKRDLNRMKSSFSKVCLFKRIFQSTCDIFLTDLMTWEFCVLLKLWSWLNNLSQIDDILILFLRFIWCYMVRRLWVNSFWVGAMMAHFHSILSTPSTVCVLTIEILPSFLNSSVLLDADLMSGLCFLTLLISYFKV